MRLLDRECQTTFPKDFSITEHFGAKEIRETYRKARAKWKKDRVYGVEPSMMSYECWHQCYENRTKSLINYTQSYGEEYHGWILGN